MGDPWPRFLEPLTSESLEQTLALGRRLGSILPANSVVCLHGELGSGKTQLVKGIVHGACGISPEHVSSPTFVYLSIYNDLRTTVYHFDLYRLRDCDEFLSMGFEEYLSAQGICCIEWSERIQPLIPEDALHITLEACGETQRHLYFDREVPWES